MMTIVEFKKKIKTKRNLEKIIRFLMRPYFWFCAQKIFFQSWLRKKGLSLSHKYDYIRTMKDTHVGEKCFIVATGPSLTFEDLDLLADAGVFCYGMNTCVYALDKTKWIPDLLGVEDEYVYENIANALLNESKGRLKDKILIGNNVEKYYKSAKNFKIFPQNILDHKYDLRKFGTIKFSDDCYEVVYDAWSILFSMCQFAIYMGFKEIYFLGCDCNYKIPKAHFIEHGVKDAVADIVGERLIYCHKKFKEFAESRGVKVFNCTRGGMLEVYPRKKLEDVLKNAK